MTIMIMNGDMYDNMNMRSRNETPLYSYLDVDLNSDSDVKMGQKQWILMYFWVYF